MGDSTGYLLRSVSGRRNFFLSRWGTLSAAHCSIVIVEPGFTSRVSEGKMDRIEIRCNLQNDFL
jgi:hypothetical protein